MYSYRSEQVFLPIFYQPEPAVHYKVRFVCCKEFLKQYLSFSISIVAGKTLISRG